MNLVPWRNKKRDTGAIEPSAMGRFRSDFERLFDRFFHDPWTQFERWPLQEWMPALDITESERDVVVRVEVPGVSARDLDIRVTGNVLTLSGEKRETSEHREENLYSTERRFGSFRRSVHLPSSVVADRVTAEHKDGIVTIRLPKVEHAKPRRIPVNISAT